MTKALLVASLTEPPSHDGEEIARLGGVAEWLEVRADLVGDLDPAWLRALFPGRLLYTLRSRAEGGAFSASRERRRQRLRDNAPGYDLIDLEGDRDLAPELLGEVGVERRLLSWHGPATELSALRSRFRHLAETPAAFYKLVPRATHAGEELATLALLAELKRPDVTAFSSGETGFWTRLVAPRLGAPLVYGSVGERPAAPGQLPIARLVSDWGLPDIAPADRLFGIVGRPALGSLSPRLHNAAYRELGIDALYVPFDVDNFGDFWLEVIEDDQLQRLALPIAGLSVTTPYKQVAFAVAGASSPLANRLEAVNTLVLRRGVWEGESTDAEGVVEALRARRVDPRGRQAAVLGCGGAGRAAALGLSLAGARVALVNRGEERGLAASRALSLPFVPLSEFDASRFDLFVHATPLGRSAGDELPFDVARTPDGAVIVDLVYGTTPTPLVAESERLHRPAIDGREVLLYQAAPQFRAMTGRELPLALGRRVLGLAERS
jgi:3-dehydroquinate dehydratase/shikimate dehydrogenase